MEKTIITKCNALSVAILTSTLAVLLLLSKPVFSQPTPVEHQRTAQSTQAVQIAHGGWGPGHRHWNRGYRPYGYIYYGPGYNPYYWGGWYNFHRGGAFCKKQCLRSRRTGEIIRCRVRCY